MTYHPFYFSREISFFLFSTLCDEIDQWEKQKSQTAENEMEVDGVKSNVTHSKGIFILMSSLFVLFLSTLGIISTELDRRKRSFLS